uniref:Uncharacterized protein n=1 Tax=Zea mays TaxID=4577 RepID=A0A804MJ13_MAIZE
GAIRSESTWTAAGSILPDPDLPGDEAASVCPTPPQRFDYYTNPAAAFTSSSGGATNPTWSHKRKSPPACYAPPPPPPAYGNYGSDYHRPHQQPTSWQVHSTSPMPQDAARSSPWQSPMQFQDPMSGYQGGPPSAPRPWGSHSGPGGRGSYSNPPNFGFRHPNPSRGGSPMNYGPRGGPYSSYGRGRGPNYFGSPGSRGRGGRVGCHGRSYFNKSMLDDPWLDLQPGVGNILIPRGEYDSNKSWLPESLRKKKETPPAQGQIKPTPGLSLAEYLDMSFNEVSDKEK